MKKSNLLSILAVLALSVFTACSGTGSGSGEAGGSLSVDEVLAEADGFTGDTITLEGVCSHLCSHGAMKAFIKGSADTVMLRCEANPYMGQPFPLEMVRRPVQVTGILVEQRVDSASVVEMEKQYAALQEKAAAEGRTLSEETECKSERTAQGQAGISSFAGRMADYRRKIAARAAKEGKPYLSFYYLEAMSYEVLPD